MESAEPGIAINILNKIESKLVSDGNIFYEKNIGLAKERIQELQARKENVSKQIKMLNQKNLLTDKAARITCLFRIL